MDCEKRKEFYKGGAWMGVFVDGGTMTDPLFRFLELLHVLGRWCQIDDLKDFNEWFNGKKIHHGTIGVLLEHLSEIGGMLIIGYNMMKDEDIFSSLDEVISDLVRVI